MFILTFDSQDPTDVLSFVSIHKAQIRQKAALHPWFEFHEYQNEVVVTILEKGKYFDPSRGSFPQFIFGHVGKRLRRVNDDALSHAHSMDDDSDRGQFVHAQVDSVAAIDPNVDETWSNRTAEMVPGAGDLATLASAISGLSASELALRMGISKRAVNMKLARAKAGAKHQCSLFDLVED